MTDEYGPLSYVRRTGVLDYRGRRMPYVRAVIDVKDRVLMHRDPEGQWYVLGEPIQQVTAMIEALYKEERSADHD